LSDYFNIDNFTRSMNYTFKEIKQFKTYNGDTSFLNELSPLQIDQLRLAIKDHVNGNLETFENCFFPLYANNEGGIEFITLYDVLDEKGDVAFDFVRVERTAGTFFKHGILQINTVLWAGKVDLTNFNHPETTHLERAWQVLNK